jgi:hypothetical protein
MQMLKAWSPNDRLVSCPRNSMSFAAGQLPVFHRLESELWHLQPQQVDLKKAEIAFEVFLL